MKKAISVILTISILFGVLSCTVYASDNQTDYTIVSPYESVNWDSYKLYKANLHTHSTVSDGEVLYGDMIKEYYNKGYDILAMTDHGVIDNGWREKNQTNGIFNYYRKTTPLTQKEYQDITTGVGRNGTGMTEITGGIEINMAVLTKSHVNGFFTTYGQGVWGKENDHATAAAEVEKAGGFSVLNHLGDWTMAKKYPERSHWNVYITYFANIFKENKSCLGMEIVNSTDNTTHADRALWDELLEVVIPLGRNVFGFANDDAHTLSRVGDSFELFALPENNVQNIKDAMQNGTFFSATRFPKSEMGHDFVGTGDVPLVKRIDIDQTENKISVSVDSSTDCDLIEWIANGKVIATGNEIDLNDYEDQLGCYIRFQMRGEGGMTYSQAMELEYEGRVDKEIPEQSWFLKGSVGKIFLSMFQTLPYALGKIIFYKVLGKIEK